MPSMAVAAMPVGNATTRPLGRRRSTPAAPMASHTAGGVHAMDTPVKSPIPRRLPIKFQE